MMKEKEGHSKYQFPSIIIVLNQVNFAHVVWASSRLTAVSLSLIGFYRTRRWTLYDELTEREPSVQQQFACRFIDGGSNLESHATVLHVLR